MDPHHPLQRLASPARSASFVLHLAGICSFLASFAYLRMFPQLPADSFGGDFQFLTILGLTLSLATFAVGYAADLSLSRQLFDAKNFLAVCVAPLEVLISVLYWTLCTIDRDLVYPPDVDVALPLLPDVGFHLAPALFLTADLLLFSPPWTIRLQEALILSLCIAFFYWAWIEYCFSFNGYYPYPIFQMLTTQQRVFLFAFSAILMTGSTVLLKRLYHILNGGTPSGSKED
ncbi:integral membrane protein [Sporothrix brasiliensis 5110]|uniref:Integral membrane protein n=1 Tax=Sporothrix brasiliensis 5110 TaxID=1398154 RepID=A0A0C2EUV4_9PEZI|nr:uncharacterized protein SPBR_00975 [Sporothrix brasiliensis 5110]KIH90349.1 integral membrane protein [Sporothrix brasiliensis 5110]